MRTRTVVVQVTRRRYQCSVCKRWDSSKERVQRCEKLSVEKKFFKVGDVITGFQSYLSGRLKAYYPQARVVAVTLEARDRNGFCDERDVAHRWLYEVKWKCSRPHCACRNNPHSNLVVYGVLKHSCGSGEYHQGVLKKVRLRASLAR